MKSIKSVLQDSLTSARLRRIRTEDLKLSQKGLATCLGVSTRTVEGWEIDKSKPITPIVRLIQLLKWMPAVRKSLCPLGQSQSA